MAWNGRFIDVLATLSPNVLSRCGTRLYMPRLSRGACLSRSGLSECCLGLAEGRNSHQIQLVVNIGGRRQVAHRGLKGLVAHPVLHGPYVETPAQHSCGIGRTKRFQIKLCRVEFGALRDRFAVVEHVLFAVSCRGWEHKLAVRAMRMLPKLVDEFHRGRNLTIFPSLRVESQLRFRGHPHSPQLEVHVTPAQEH